MHWVSVLSLLLDIHSKDLNLNQLSDKHFRPVCRDKHADKLINRTFGLFLRDILKIFENKTIMFQDSTLFPDFLDDKDLLVPSMTSGPLSRKFVRRTVP